MPRNCPLGSITGPLLERETALFHLSFASPAFHTVARLFILPPPLLCRANDISVLCLVTCPLCSFRLLLVIYVVAIPTVCEHEGRRWTLRMLRCYGFIAVI